MRNYKIAAIPADGIGGEVIVAGLDVLAALARLMRAIEQVTKAGLLTPDLGGTATTDEVTRAVIDAISGSNILLKP